MNEATTNDTVRVSLNRANPNALADNLRRVSLGNLIASSIPQNVRGIDMDAAGTNVGNLATLDVLVLPDNAKASIILRAFARTGTAGTGEMTVAAKDATPVTTQIAVAPNGNIVTLAADAITDVDILYVPEGDCIVVESYYPVAADAVTLPTIYSAPGVVALLEAELVAGTATGSKIILTRGGAPAAGQASLNVAGTTVSFAAADAGTRARLKFLVAPATADQVRSILESAAISS